MIKKFYLFILLCLLLCPTIEGQNAKASLKGKVIAYVEPNVDAPSHSFVPKSDVLIVRVTRSRKIKDEVVKIVAEYFSEKSPLSADVFKGEEWQFRVSRRTDCDSLLIPDSSELRKSVEKQTGEIFTFDTPSVKFIRPDEADDVPKNIKLSCYSYIRTKRLRK